jgi:predicted GH43/DUF377 family glycosyl hydrolase
MHQRRRILGPEHFAPSRADFEVAGAFNPGAARVGETTVLLVRVAERPRERRPGWVGLPRWDPEQGMLVDWEREDDIAWVDARVVIRKADGRARLTFASHLVVVRDGVVTADRFLPQGPLEEYGVEDPRITPLGDRFLVTYVAVSQRGVTTALASTADFRSFERLGIIFGPENKDVVVFPGSVGDDYVALHRPTGRERFALPEMWLARSPDLLHWGRHAFLYGGLEDWESGRLGAGPPPVLLPDGSAWLAIYHGNTKPTRPGEVGAYVAAALLLDRDDPSRIVRRTGLLFGPELDYELDGFVPNVVFPTGTVADEGGLWVYYGSADESVGVGRLTWSDVIV